MSTKKEDDNWECTAEIQQKLLKLYSKNKKKWKADVSKMLRDHPSKFSILTVGVQDDGDNQYTFDEFASHFGDTISNQQLLRLIYDDIDHFDDTHVKFVAIHRWVNEVKLQKETQVIKNHKWLFTKILHVQAAHLDTDGSGEVDRQEFVGYFVDKIGFPIKIANAMFEDIDVNGDGDLSIMEYTKWKSKHNKPDKLKKFLDKMEKVAKEKEKQSIKESKEMEVNGGSEDSKCNECAGIKREMKDLNGRYKQMELKVKSVSSKHTNLLQDYKKLSQLLDEAKTPKKRVSTNGNKDKQKMETLMKQNRKLSEESRIRSTELSNITQSHESLQKQLKRLGTENEDLRTENDQYLSKSSTSKAIKEKVAKLELQIKLKNEEIETLQEQISSAPQSSNAANNSTKLKMYEQENEELNDKIDTQTKKLRDLKKEMNAMEEGNDELKIEISTKTEEIRLLKERMSLNKNSDSDRSQQLKEENEALEFRVNKQKKEIKRLKEELEEECDSRDKIEKEKRAIKAELNKKEGSIAILTHKIELSEQNSEMNSGTDNDQIKKLRNANQELSDETMTQQTQIKNLKEQISNLSADIMKEKEHFHKLQIELDKEKSSTEHYMKSKESESQRVIAKESDITDLMSERQTLKQEILALNALLEKHNIERQKISAEKDALMNKVETEKSQKANTAESVQSELDSLRNKYSELLRKYDENEAKQSTVNTQNQEEISKLAQENASLSKKVQTEKNHLNAVLAEVTELEQKQKDLESNKVGKLATKAKHDISKLNIQIEILNSDVFRVKSLLLLSKYEKIDKRKYYGFLDFAHKDLSSKALANVYKKLGVKDKISAAALAPLLGVIVKLYKIRLVKLKTGKAKQTKNSVDRRVIEHLGVWLIRQHSTRTKQSESVRVLNDANQEIKGTYVVYAGYILKKEMDTLFASWCQEYVECEGRHDDSKL